MELWFLYAIGAAVFAALTTILAKIGLKDVNSHVATAIRTVVVLVFAWIIAVISGAIDGFSAIDSRTWIFMILSAFATGGSWLCYFRALQLGDVNKVVPIDKSSTILTMLLAFIFLNEPVGIVTIIGMVLMGFGTWLMLEFKPQTDDKQPKPQQNWLLFAILAAVFASLAAIFSRIGVVGIDANLWTALRTTIAVPLALLMVLLTNSHKKEKRKKITTKTWIFLIAAGVATGVSWLFFYHALQLGHASHVVPIDKLSILGTMIFARLFLQERFSWRSIGGLVLLTVGTLLPIFLS